MRSRQSAFLPLAFVLGAVAMAVPAPASAKAVLAAHRAIYDLTLSSGGSGGIESASGRIVLELTGSACDGYAQSVRQVVEMVGQEMPRLLLDYRSTTFESGDGRSLRFNRDNRKNAEPDVVEGRADAAPGQLVIRVTKPERRDLTFKNDVIFPSMHMKKIIEAAQAGETRLEANLFDGTDDPDKVFNAVATIAAAPRTGAAGLDEASRKAGLTEMKRWPVLLSFYEIERNDQSPLHSVGFEMFENGIARALRLDYGDFSLKGELSGLEVLKPSTCDR
jgi:hypothetical protein